MSTCPSSLELSSGLRHERHPWRKHISSCARCTDEVTALERVRSLVRELPAAADTADVDERRAQLLALASPTPTGSGRRVGVAAFGIVAACAAALVVLVRRTPEAHAPTRPSEAVGVISPVHRGSVQPHPGAQFSIVGDQPDEIVRLRDGTILVEVNPLQSGERFRVIVGDAEVEVRGTAFEVAASQDRLVAVLVRHGRVEVRHHDDAPVMLGAGDAWKDPSRDPIAVAAPPETKKPPPHAKPRLTEHAVVTTIAPPSPIPPVASESDAAFQTGVASLRTGNVREAARAFERVIAIDASGPLVEDARFWLAVARARSGDSAVAIHAFEAFLSAHPRSPRAGKASAMVGWLLVEAKDLDGAKRRFAVAVNDADAEVRASASAGLAELARLR